MGFPYDDMVYGVYFNRKAIALQHSDAFSQIPASPESGVYRHWMKVNQTYVSSWCLVVE
jgi:hypothetical protein